MNAKLHRFWDGVFSQSMPVIPLVGIHGAQLATIDVEKALQDGSLMAESQLHALDTYGYDGILSFMDLTLEAEALGCKIVYHKDIVPSVAEALFTDVQDHDLIDVTRIEESERVEEFIRAAELMKEAVDGENAVVGAYITGPFTLAGQLMGMESLFENMMLYPDVFEQILEKTGEITTVMGEKYKNLGLDMIIILDPMASSDLISPRHFGTMVKPFIRKVIQLIDPPHALVVLHICGDTTPILYDMIDCGIDALSIDSKVDIAHAAHLCADDVGLIGNIDPVNMLLKGSSKDVDAASHQCIEASVKANHFVLSSGCEVPKDTPVENILAMVRVARTYTRAHESRG
jgi:MtaA/CmuA family methyltransferase